MVRAIVGANWGDEGKGKITDMLPSRRISLSASRAVPTPDTPSSMSTGALRCT